MRQHSFYDVADAPLLLGREKLTAELVNFVREHAFLAIVGASGSGKSSLAPAGQCGRGELDAAITSYRKAVEASPTYASAYHDLALAYEAKWRADPGHGSNWCTLALAAWRKTHELGSKQPMLSTGSYPEGIQDHIDSLQTRCN